MKTYYYRPVGSSPPEKGRKLMKLKQPVTLCQACAEVERSHTVLTNMHTPEQKCDRCGKEKTA